MYENIPRQDSNGIKHQSGQKGLTEAVIYAILILRLIFLRFAACVIPVYLVPVRVRDLLVLGVRRFVGGQIEPLPIGADVFQERAFFVYLATQDTNNKDCLCGNDHSEAYGTDG
ncbi:hypothetical protein CC86DRAFT_388628 [Ophiobolus disseminans]|uniref:Uncharacterized protein n=1 Tax=Ophiobolus disseminans TaxID=1469910 RepID=A0A6A6ZD28_9PLEO|nr:hypothetical protein CC86DRAFT_388628 [Ophiobolus disseminans]